jgi:hypothetical protein
LAKFTANSESDAHLTLFHNKTVALLVAAKSRFINCVKLCATKSQLGDKETCWCYALSINIILEWFHLAATERYQNGSNNDCWMGGMLIKEKKH